MYDLQDILLEKTLETKMITTLTYKKAPDLLINNEDMYYF